MRYSICLMAMLAGCAARTVAIDYSVAPPADWPKLEERITKVNTDTIEKFCPGAGGGVRPLRMNGCAATRFRVGICDIYLFDPTDQGSLEHERAHCRGYGHVGDADAPAKAWATYKERNGL
jgi:hypothetical protein